MQTYRNPTKTQQENTTIPNVTVINSDIKVSPRSSRKSEVSVEESEFGFMSIFGFGNKKKKEKT